MKSFLLMLVVTLLGGLPIASQQEEHIPMNNVNNDSLFFSNILHDRSNNSYFLSLNIYAPDYKGRVVIENLLLYRFLSLTRNMNWKEYRNYMLGLLLQDDTLKTDVPIDELSGTTKKWAFQKIEPDKEVIAYARQGEEAFINHFFTKTNETGTIGVLKEEHENGLNNTERINRFFSIVNQLFVWHIYSSHQGVSGNLIYSREGPPDFIRKRWLQEDQNQ